MTQFPPRFILIIVFAMVVLSYSPFRLISWLCYSWIEQNRWRYFVVFGYSLIPSFVILGGNFVSHFFVTGVLSRIILHFSVNVGVVDVVLFFPCIFLEFIFGFVKSVREYWYIVEIALLFFTLAYVVIGLMLGRRVIVKKIKVKSASASVALSVVHISDTHIGTHSGSFLRKVVEKSNQLEPDIVCLTGDILDSGRLVQTALQNNKKSNEKREISDPLIVSHSLIPSDLQALGDIRAKHGVFFILGNHEYFCGFDNVERLVQTLFPNICLVRNRIVDFIIPPPYSHSPSSSQAVRIIGIDDGNAKYFAQALDSVLSSPSFASFTPASPCSSPLSPVTPSSSPSSTYSLFSPSTSSLSSTSTSSLSSPSTSSSSSPSTSSSSSPSTSSSSSPSSSYFTSSSVFSSSSASSSSSFSSPTNTFPFTILLHHQPHNIWKSAMKNAKADMMLAGHTHNGQLFPMYPLVRIVFNPAAGLCPCNNSVVEADCDGNKGEEKKEMGRKKEKVKGKGKEKANLEFTPFLYINPGTGTWGTSMRTSSVNEITLFEISPLE